MICEVRLRATELFEEQALVVVHDISMDLWGTNERYPPMQAPRILTQRGARDPSPVRMLRCRLPAVAVSMCEARGMSDVSEHTHTASHTHTHTLPTTPKTRNIGSRMPRRVSTIISRCYLVHTCTMALLTRETSVSPSLRRATRDRMKPRARMCVEKRTCPRCTYMRSEPKSAQNRVLCHLSPRTVLLRMQAKSPTTTIASGEV